MSAYVQPAALANSAKLNRSWVTKAAALGLVNPSTLDGEDLIVVRVFAFVDQLVWPGKSRSRSEARVMEPWQSLAVNAARAAARDPATRLDSILWVAPDGVEVTHEPGAHSAFVLGRPRSMFVAVPLGEWIAELPPNLETLFHWPRQIMESSVALDDSTTVSLRAFSTVPRLVTVFASTVAPLQEAAYAKVIQHVTAQHPGLTIRLIEWLSPNTRSQWAELYELPGGGIVRRPLDRSTLLDEFGPQLKRLNPGTA
ncbi:hypothetical protein ABZ776_21325 [Streptomyces sp. NPDC007076]|uniref:hypothetical protein n=1 Tax=Streptomyces sp. NPDC007076 TaxID=3160975 RepID=UPI0034007B11